MRSPSRGPITRFCSRPCKWASHVAAPLADRFWKKVAKGDGCWNWIGRRNALGYGFLKALNGRRQVRAHRISWELHFGPIPDGLAVLHRCDNPPCVRPDHLFLGTQTDNMRDMWTKGRGRSDWTTHRGAGNGRAKLSEADVLAIRASTESGVALARQYGVTKCSISAVRLQRTWRHL
jgi:hypothetical protein